MLNRIKYIDENTKQVAVMSEASNKAWAVKNGYSTELYEVEEGYNSDYYLKDHAPLKPLSDIKRAKIEEINQARDNEEQSGFTYLGKVFDSNPLSVGRLFCAAQSALIAKQTRQEFLVVWTTKDNTTIDLTADDMMGAISSLATHGNALHQKATSLKEQVNNKATSDEVDGVIW